MEASGSSSLGTSKKRSYASSLSTDIADKTTSSTSTSEVPSKRTKRVNSAQNRSVANSKLQNTTTDVAQSNPNTQIAFWLTKSPWVSTEANKYSLSLDQIIALPTHKSETSNIAIEHCYAFNFKVDLQWMIGVCPILCDSAKVNHFTLVHGGSKDCHYDMLPMTEIYPHFSIFKAKLPYSYGCHHTKMFLIVYPNGIRVVISTANIIEKDYCHKTNAMFLQDFPLKDTSSMQTSQFEKDLFQYCKAIGLKIDFSFLQNYDFSAAKVYLCGSVPGYFKGDRLNSFGHMRIRSLLSTHLRSDLKLSPTVAQFSSIGTLSHDWLIDELGKSLNSTNESENDSKQEEKASLAIIWPTVDDVRNSIEGYNAGGSLCFSLRCNKPFLSQYFHRWNANSHHSKRQRLMPHIKSYCRIDSSKELKYFLLTSSNCSRAAWGSLQQKETQLFIRSYELGVLYLPHLQNDVPSFWLTQMPSLDAKTDESELYRWKFDKFEVIFPIPHKIENVMPYAKTDKPWIWDIEYLEPDMRGASWTP